MQGLPWMKAWGMMFFSAFLVFESMAFPKNRPERNRLLPVTQEELASMPTETPVPESVRARNILDRVPAYLANTLTQGSWPSPLELEQQTSKSNNSELFISGRSTWHTSESDCDRRDKIIRYQLLFGTQLSTTCTFADDSRFANWPGIQGEPENFARGNYFAILAFAWAYVLSAC